MVRRLVLVRHAKSCWDDETLDDHDRPLAPRGERSLDRMRDHVSALNLPTLFVLCSTATRAEATLDGLRPALPDDAAIEHDRGVYDDDARTLLDRIRRSGEEHASLMVVGHNPHLSDLACLLIEARSGAIEMRKSGLVCFDLISMGPQPRATLNWMMTPRSSGA